MSDLPSVDDLRADLPTVLARFRAGHTHAFSFGAGVPEAVLLTWDEFDNLNGDTKFTVPLDVLNPTELAERLPAVLDALRAGVGDPVVWGESGEPEAVVLSTAQYRTLRGDNEPPPSTYTTSRPMSVDEIAALMGPEAVRDLEEIRRDT